MAIRDGLYPTIWRWHFYAGILITPIMLVMAITGGIYLFQHEIEDALYGELFYRQDVRQPVSNVDHDAIVNAAKKELPGGILNSYRPAHGIQENARVTLTDTHQQRTTIMVNPDTLTAVGSINDSWRLTAIAKQIHGGLMAGTLGEVLVELVACWTIIMIVTGLYLWWPRIKGLRGALIPRLNQSSRIAWRDFHAIPGFLLSVWMLVIIATGLPWSVVWGNLLDQFAIGINQAFPQEVFSRRPQSQPATIPGQTQVSVNQLVHTAHQNGFHHGFEIQSPWGPNGSFAIMPGHHGRDLAGNRYLFVDQYSGSVLLKIEWQDIGAIGQATSIGISLHEGRLFGRSNQIINLIALIVLIWMGISGMILWLKRKPEGSLGAPKARRGIQPSRALGITVLTLAIALPLAGLSMLCVWLLDKTLNRVRAV